MDCIQYSLHWLKNHLKLGVVIEIVCTDNVVGSSSKEVGKAIREGILSRKFESDQFIRESIVTNLLNVSRTPVREVFRMLASEGWLEIIPNQGARVSAWSEQTDRDVFELWIALEPLAVELTTSHITGPAETDDR